MFLSWILGEEEAGRVVKEGGCLVESVSPFIDVSTAITEPEVSEHLPLFKGLFAVDAWTTVLELSKLK